MLNKILSWAVLTIAVIFGLIAILSLVDEITIEIRRHFNPCYRGFMPTIINHNPIIACIGSAVITIFFLFIWLITKAHGDDETN